MKKRIIFLAVLLFLFPVLSAVEFNMSSEFAKGETLTAKVSGNFINPILKENIKFYRGHVRVSIEPFVAKINDDFYIYAQLPETENNYSIVISEVEYYSGSTTTDTNLTKNFTITNSTADFSVEPGFAVADKNFSFQLQNLKDSSITVSVEQETISGSEETFTVEDSVLLKSGEIKKIEFKLENTDEQTFKMIKLITENFSYEIPVYVYGEEVSEFNETDEDNYIDLDEDDEEVINDGEEISEEEYVPETSDTCDELDGKICSSNEECSGETKYAQDGICCLASCEKVRTSSTGKIIGWVLLVGALGFIFWFFKFKYKKAKREVNVLDIGKGK